MPSTDAEREPGEVTPLVVAKATDGSLVAALGQGGTGRSVPTEVLETSLLGTASALGLFQVPLATIVPRSLFFDNAMQVLAFARGAARAQSTSLSFQLSAAQMSDLKAWGNRYEVSK